MIAEWRKRAHSFYANYKSFGTNSQIKYILRALKLI